MRPYRYVAFWSPVLVVMACATAALAGKTEDDAARAAARASGYDGVQAYQSGNMAVAVDKLGRAFDVVKVPTLGLWYARALVKTGNLVEASERYREVVHLEITEGKIKEQQQAQAEAADELAALQPKIPSLTLMVADCAESCEITLDGNPVRTKLMGMATPINPGIHRIQAKRGGQLVEQSVTLKEGEKRSVELELGAAPRAALEQAKPGDPTPGTGPGTRDSATRTSHSKGSTQKTIGWISLGLGGVATATGIVTGVLGISKRSKLDDSGHCTGTVCNDAERDNLASYNQMRTISAVGFIVGAVGIGAGTTLLLTAPKPSDATVSAWLGVGSVGVRGSF